MSREHFKILMYTEEYNNRTLHYVYNSITRTIQQYTEDDIKNSKEHIRCMDSSKRKDGRIAVLYQVEPQRYIVVNSHSIHAFRTLRELMNRPELYFNVNIGEDGIRSLDGTIQKADEYIKSLTYIDMYKPRGRVVFGIDKQTGKASIVNYAQQNIGEYKVPNFVSILESYSFADKDIQAIDIANNIKVIKKLAFKGSHIGTLRLSPYTQRIESSAFIGATVDKLEIVNYEHCGDNEAFTGANIGLLDLAHSRIKQLNFNIVYKANSVRTIRMPFGVRTLNLDEAPKDLHSVITSSKNLVIHCKDKDKLNILKARFIKLGSTSREKELIVDNM